MDYFNETFAYLLDPEYWRTSVGYMFAFFQSGINMIPTLGWRQSLEAWANERTNR